MNFGWNLLKQTAKGNDGNVFLSPANVSIALAMTANGAKGDTFSAMSQLVASPNATLDQLNADYAALQTLLKRSDDKVSVSLANALWAKQGVPFDAAFLGRARDTFGARVSELDFNSADAPGTINQWVRDSTNNKIDGIIDHIDPAMVLLLTSAIHFKGAWATPFDKASTVDMPFNLSGGKQQQTPMMLRVGKMRYLKTEVGQAVQLPYAGDALRMVVLLPDESVGADAALDKLNAQQWRTWQGAFTVKQGTLYLPRFKAESDLSLNDALSQLGMGIAFDAQKADFSGMRPVPPQLVITGVRHKSFVDVNEEGTEAAAATSVGVGVTSARPIDETFDMNVNRPFIIAIEDAATGALLFAGVIRQPK